MRKSQKPEIEKKTTLELIRPERLDKIQDNLHLLDLEELRRNYPDLTSVNCIACNSNNYRKTYEKYGYIYNRCNICNSLFISPRLPKEGLSYFFKNAKSMAFRAKDFYQTVAVERKKKIFYPRWKKIKKALASLGVFFPIQNALEIGASVGLFTSVVLEMGDVINYEAIEPSKIATEHLKRIGVKNVYNGVEEEYTGKLYPIYDVIFCNGVIEHPFSPYEFLNNLKMCLKVGGFIVVCSPGGSGIDSILLAENQPNAVPPHMQNFISNQGLYCLAKRCSLNLVRLESIGQLDMDIVFQHLQSYENNYSSFMKDERLRKDFQLVLQKHSLTGFYMAILQKSSL